MQRVSFGASLEQSKFQMQSSQKDSDAEEFFAGQRDSSLSNNRERRSSGGTK
jgi:hypothetical protein